MSTQQHTITIQIRVPYQSEMDADTVTEIMGSAASGEDWDDAVDRYLGGPITDAVTLLANWLPEGWSVSASTMPETETQRDLTIPDTEYDQGFIDGLTAFAWWKDGEQFVGTTGATLKDAVRERYGLWNYNG